MKRFVAALIATATLAVTASSNAQVWLRDRRGTQGTGINSGDWEIHPGIGAEVGYDSNYFNRSPNNTSGYPVVSTSRLRITPSISVGNVIPRNPDGTLGRPPKVQFTAGAAVTYSQFLSNTDKLGRSNEAGVSADAALLIAPGRPWGFNILDNFTRTAQPSLDPDPNIGLDRDDNRTAAEIVYTKPGGLFDWRLGGAYAFTYFEKSSVRPLDSSHEEIYTKGRWKFLPRTALVYDASLQFWQWSQKQLGLNNSTPVRTRIGLSGLFTERLAATVMVGWGASFYKNNQDFDSVIGQAELRYFLGGAAPEAGTATPGTSSLAFGATRDFQNSYIGNFYERNRVYLQLTALFAQRFYVALEGGVSIIRYSEVLDRTTGAQLTNRFNDTRYDASLFAEYRVRDWLGFNGTVQLLGESSSTKIPAQTPSGVLDLTFTRVQALGGVRVFF